MTGTVTGVVKFRLVETVWADDTAIEQQGNDETHDLHSPLRNLHNDFLWVFTVLL